MIFCFDSAENERNEVEMTIDLASRFPNITGVMMDDFFTNEGKGRVELDKLKIIRNRLTVPGRKLDLWVVLYTHQLHLPVEPYLEFCDIITLWTWNSDDLDDFSGQYSLRPESGSCRMDAQMDQQNG